MPQGAAYGEYGPGPNRDGLAMPLEAQDGLWRDGQCPDPFCTFRQEPAA